MSPGFTLFLFALGVVAFFMLAFAITIIVKGRYMDSEIGTNAHMQKRGIRCTSQEFRNEELLLRGEIDSLQDCQYTGCDSCTLGRCEQHPETGQK